MCTFVSVTLGGATKEWQRWKTVKLGLFASRGDRKHRIGQNLARKCTQWVYSSKPNLARIQECSNIFNIGYFYKVILAWKSIPWARTYTSNLAQMGIVVGTGAPKYENFVKKIRVLAVFRGFTPTPLSFSFPPLPLFPSHLSPISLLLFPPQIIGSNPTQGKNV